MNQEQVLDFLLEGATLKWMPRTGWAMRGVPQVESVAEHTFGVAFVCLALVDALTMDMGQDSSLPRLSLEKVLVIALLHDLAEVRLTDLPASARRLIPEEVKRQAEIQALSDMLAPLSRAAGWQELWQEFEDESSPEGDLVRDADKLEMMVQCLRYEQAGCRGLAEFWASMDQRDWNYALCANLYARLKAKRPELPENGC
jgi:putative hydrolase of HD superfamily